MILVVDDHPINRRLLADQLGSLGYQCKTANDGVDALNVLSKNHIDIVLSDVNMPNMDGYRTTEEIRSLPDKRAQIPIVAMTANVFDEDKKKAYEAGMNGYIAKPIDTKAIFSTLGEILQEKSEN